MAVPRDCRFTAWMLRRTLVIALVALAAPAAASASELIDRNATGVRIGANDKGEALLTYRASGKLKNVLAWGAMNAVAPNPAGRQLEFKLDYAGGWGKYRRAYAKEFKSTCGAYRGQELQWFVTGCTARDGSHWAVQAWQRALPNYGLAPTAKQAVWELRLSHWTGELPVLTINLDWSYRRFHHLYGTYAYAGNPVFGYRSTSGGVPLDTFGRNVYLDTFGSAYGSGWKRENSFLTHTRTGTFCYGFYDHGSRPEGNGTRYRATIIGPGVTPDAYWQGTAQGPYDPDADRADLDRQREMLAGDRLCKAL